MEDYGVMKGQHSEKESEKKSLEGQSHSAQLKLLLFVFSPVSQFPSSFPYLQFILQLLVSLVLLAESINDTKDISQTSGTLHSFKHFEVALISLHTRGKASQQT